MRALDPFLTSASVAKCRLSFSPRPSPNTAALSAHAHYKRSFSMRGRRRFLTGVKAALDEQEVVVRWSRWPASLRPLRADSAASSVRQSKSRNTMTIRNLEQLLAPQSIALIGESAREGSVGRQLAANLTLGGFGGPIHFVNPNR